MNPLLPPRIFDIYTLLFDRFGPQGWWPGDTPFEIAVGAILTQNTGWINAARAVGNLKEAGVLSCEGLSSLSPQTLAELIKPAGYFNLKAKRLGNFLGMIRQHYGTDFALFLNQETAQQRQHLLSVSGIGPETADSILLYAAQKPVFVIDAYTYRILFRHHLVEEETDYDHMQALFTDNLATDTKLFNEYHALIVRVGKEFCRRSKPLCEKCPLFAV